MKNIIRLFKKEYIGQKVRIKSTANVAKRYLGRLGIVDSIDFTKRRYYALIVRDRKSLLWVLEDEIEKV